jgi:hypothetical protein
MRALLREEHSILVLDSSFPLPSWASLAGSPWAGRYESFCFAAVSSAVIQLEKAFKETL